MKKISLKKWKDFPTFISVDLEEVCVQQIEYRGKVVKVGDFCEWQYSPESEMVIFQIDAIRINPSLRFWSNGKWYLAVNCSIIIPKIKKARRKTPYKGRPKTFWSEKLRCTIEVKKIYDNDSKTTMPHGCKFIRQDTGEMVESTWAETVERLRVRVKDYINNKKLF